MYSEALLLPYLTQNGTHLAQVWRRSVCVGSGQGVHSHVLNTVRSHLAKLNKFIRLTLCQWMNTTLCNMSVHMNVAVGNVNK